MENYVSNALKDETFGESVSTFYFGFELADTKKWGKFFEETKCYISYRPKMKGLVSVGQLEWLEVKDLPWIEQFRVLQSSILESIMRTKEMKRKPKHFDYADFASKVNCILGRFAESRA